MRRTWSKCGRTPVLKAWDRHDRLTAITALVFEPHRKREFSMYFQLQRRNANAASFVWFLTELRKELRNQMIVIWDRLAAHRRTETLFRQLEFPWASFEYLPAYCPQLNPVEHVWATTKYGRLANWPAPDIDQLNDRLTNEFEKQQAEQELLQSHFKWAKLELE